MKLKIYAWYERTTYGCSAFLYWAEPPRTSEWFPYMHQDTKIDRYYYNGDWIGCWYCELTRL